MARDIAVRVSGLSRREFLRDVGGVGAAGLVGACGPRGPGRIEHIVVVMMENRSFDHVFGDLSLSEDQAVDGLVAGLSNDLPDGTPVAPFPVESYCPADPPHTWEASHTAFADGANSGFVQACYDEYQNADDARQVMAYQSRAHMPASYALADAYCLCERWFSSVLTSTWPNRLYLHGAQSEGATANVLPEAGFFSMPTIWDRLDDAGIAWAYYYTSLPYISLFRRFDTRSELQEVGAFFDACTRGVLPPVCMVDPPFGVGDDHPPAKPAMGQVFLASIHQALATSPLWEKVLLVVVYDEAGGFFDHVPPGTAPDDRAADGFGQLGFRVPAIVAGPWVKPGVSDIPFDHTSVLAHIERMFGLPPLTARDAAANDLTALLDADRMAANDPYDPAILPTVAISTLDLVDTCRTAATVDTGQRELEAIVPCHLDRRPDLPETWRRLVDTAVALGVVATTERSAPADNAGERRGRGGAGVRAR
jgi:phospholipase C